MNWDAYLARLTSRRCLVCPLAAVTHGSSGGQRQCRSCRRKWSFGRLELERKLLEAFATGEPLHVAAKESRCTLPTALGWFGVFRQKLALHHTARFRREVIDRTGSLFVTDAAGSALHQLGAQAGIFDPKTSKCGVTHALVVGEVVAFGTGEQVAAAAEWLREMERPCTTHPIDLLAGGDSPHGLCTFGLAIRAAIRGKRRVAPLHRPAYICEAAERIGGATPAAIRDVVFTSLIEPRYNAALQQ
jgi:hypothetical protein